MKIIPSLNRYLKYVLYTSPDILSWHKKLTLIRGNEMHNLSNNISRMLIFFCLFSTKKISKIFKVIFHSQKKQKQKTLFIFIFLPLIVCTKEGIFYSVLCTFLLYSLIEPNSHCPHCPIQLIVDFLCPRQAHQSTRLQILFQLHL